MNFQALGDGHKEKRNFIIMFNNPMLVLYNYFKTLYGGHELCDFNGTHLSRGIINVVDYVSYINLSVCH